MDRDRWEFEAAGLEDCLAEDRAHGKPVLNTEFGYQHEPGYESGMNHATRQCHQPSTVRKKAWKIATAGAYFAAGFEGTAVRNFTEGDVDNFRPHSWKCSTTSSPGERSIGRCRRAWSW